MINLPDSTRVFKQIPKENFIKYLDASNPLEKKFMEEIGSIVLINKLSPETMTISQGKIVIEIAVVEIFLKRQVISQTLIELLNREIDQTAVFIIRYEDWGQIWCSNNESSNDQLAEYKVDTYYQTNWLPYDELELKAEGDDLDQVYENFLMQITGKPIKLKNGKPQKKPIKKTEEPAALEEEDDLEEVAELKVIIENLETKINHEKQFKLQLDLMVDLINAKEELQKIIAPHLMKSKIVHTDQMSLLQNNIEMIQSFFPHVFVNMIENDENEFADTSAVLKTIRMP
ncbi:MAG: DUF4391 domain-containing protein [Eubacteriaceae bacterium]|nr:DUF4391 domain-containing protein [Eubacteriaceae bacterium]